MKTSFHKIINLYKPEIYQICEKYNVIELYFFGSATNEKFREGQSDIDILVKLNNENKKNVVRLNIDLGILFNCPIDIFEESWINNSEFKSYLNNNKKLFYRKTSTNIINHC
jgi:predicted nucleotidyltransferase